MKKIICFFLSILLLSGCAASPAPGETVSTETVSQPQPAPVSFAGTIVQDPAPEAEYVSRFDWETVIGLSDDGITVDGGEETDEIFTSHDIIYYEDRESYESGYPYGEGTAADKHTAEEAAAHTVVNITAPGAYRISGRLSAGQIRIDLGDGAYEDPNAVVELILDNADITCTVAPAIVFLNTYECDGNWSAETAVSEVDTSNAGANLILEGRNTVSGSYVAKIYKDNEGEKKLWKQDGAVYSYMSLNVFGPGSLDLNAANEGLDTELHLTINGGSITIRSDNDGINTNEDGVSVTTINGGSLHIIAGLGEEGDGIDSNGYLVINGGTVVASAKPAADAGLDSDLGSYINGGIVVAMGSSMDWAESDSDQVTMNLQFGAYQSVSSAIVISDPEGQVVFAYDPGEDEILGQNARQYMGAILSSPGFTQGDSYLVFTDGTITGEETGGIYSTVSAYEGGTQMAYTGTDVTMHPGGFGGQRPVGFNGEKPDRGEWKDGSRGERPEMPDGEMPSMPEDLRPEMPEDFTMPEGMERPEGAFGNRNPMGGAAAPGEGNALFYMQDKVNFFSGVSVASES